MLRPLQDIEESSTLSIKSPKRVRRASTIAKPKAMKKKQSKKTSAAEVVEDEEEMKIPPGFYESDMVTSFAKVMEDGGNFISGETYNNAIQKQLCVDLFGFIHLIAKIVFKAQLRSQYLFDGAGETTGEARQPSEDLKHVIEDLRKLQEHLPEIPECKKPD